MKKWVMVFENSWWGSVTNVCKMRCEMFGCKSNWSWLGFGLVKLGGLAFCALVAKLVKKWSHGFCEILVVNCHKCMQNEVWKVWLQRELIFVGCWLSQVGWIGFLCLSCKIGEKVKSWFWSILVGNCHKCIPNEVSKVWLPKELILVGFWVSQVGWIGFLCLAFKIGEKRKSSFLSNLGGEFSQLHSKWGVKSLVAKEIDIGWVLA